MSQDSPMSPAEATAHQAWAEYAAAMLVAAAAYRRFLAAFAALTDTAAIDRDEGRSAA